MVLTIPGVVQVVPESHYSKLFEASCLKHPAAGVASELNNFQLNVAVFSQLCRA